MRWTDLLSETETVVLPYLGGRTVHAPARTFRVRGALPDELGWHRFEVDGSRRATWVGAGEPDFGFEEALVSLEGYLVGDRLLPDGADVSLDLDGVVARTRPVALVPRGLGRFARAKVARLPSGALVFAREELPLGPEPDVLDAYQARLTTIAHVPGVTPALHLAFLFYALHRERADAARREAERQAREAAEREARRDAYVRAIGDRRARLANDFEEAARAALALGGADLLDSYPAPARGERVVQFRFERRRFECVVEAATLRVIDSGICLIDHLTGEHGDQRFTLESLVAVIDEAIRTGRLVVFRHPT